MKKKRFIIISLCFIILNFSACYKPSSENSFYDKNKSENTSMGSKETIMNYDYNDDDLNINWGYGCKLDGIVYTIKNNRLWYYEDGKIKNICRDPLCKHIDLNCASNKAAAIDLVTTDGEKLYCLGYHYDENPEYKKAIEAGRTPDKDEYIVYDGIYEVNPQTQKMKVVTKWEKPGISTPMLRVKGDYVYFVKVSSTSKSDLYRVKKSGGEPELVSKNNDGSISGIVFGKDWSAIIFIDS